MRELQAQARGGRTLTPIRWFWVAAFAALIVDLVSKAVIIGILGEPPPDGRYTDENTIWILPNAFRLISALNKGGAFGFASGKIFLFLTATAVLVPALVLMAYYTREPDAPLWSLGMIVGGAVGNLYDRLMHDGVRDFLDIVNPRTERSLWPVFNAADVAIVVGVIVYVLWSVVDTVRRRRETPYDDTAEEAEA